ncbi:hypothetical protein B566_EDAN011299 [Ephemera danica]|nr:hypothetical protein B566_EDAN011299 [Ephemera danica]
MDNFLCVSSEVLSSNISNEQFWKGIRVWIRSPHVENRRLCGVKDVICGSVSEPSSAFEIIKQLLKIANQGSLSSTDSTSTQHVLENAGIRIDIDTPVEEPSEQQNVVLKIRELIPKNTNLFQPCREAIVLDGPRTQATFIHLGPFSDSLCPHTPYSCNFKPHSEKEGGVLEFSLWLEGEKGVVEEGNHSWLKSKLFPRLVKWIVLEHGISSILPESSLNLVDLQKYNDKYQELKQKYGPRMVEIWPEQTDPLKFVYEDLAIASYLLCLWDCHEGGRKVSFADLGCGNGLLVYILNSEGHPGMGLDVRSRKLWSLYPPTTDLKASSNSTPLERLFVQSITPSLDTTFPEYDWIIGNHSDELTPWIPVLSAASSPKSSFFLLPCCAHDFWGKFQRLNPNNSQYTEYIMFVRTVGETCGFKVEIDKLRIPSTKRTCLIGRSRFKSVDKTVLWEYVTSRKQSGQEDFSPRSNVEPVRNCTKLASGVTEQVLKSIVDRLLRGFMKDTESWWAGNELPLSEAAALLPQALRTEMKKECGGLQTLLRNHHSIFLVQGGTVKFREPKPSSSANLTRWKQKPCWFFLNHPQGCPLEEDQCSFNHVHAHE